MLLVRVAHFFCVKSVNLFGVLVGIAYLCSGDDRGHGMDIRDNRVA